MKTIRKFTWGHGVTIAFVLFVCYILSFVYRSFFNEVDLVAEDYYAQEIAYQDRIDHTSNANYVAMQIEVTKTVNGIVVRFPSSEQVDEGTGTIQFFRPSDEDLDVKVPLQLMNETQQLPLQLFRKGRYKVNLSWTNNGEGRYVTKEIII